MTAHADNNTDTVNKDAGPVHTSHATTSANGQTAAASGRPSATRGNSAGDGGDGQDPHRPTDGNQLRSHAAGPNNPVKKQYADWAEVSAAAAQLATEVDALAPGIEMNEQAVSQ